jgi:hypothetical protein
MAIGESRFDKDFHSEGGAAGRGRDPRSAQTHQGARTSGKPLP